ncbi:endonuclease/exonuclease/phosphatase family protein [Plantactinospora siamensis]|uniref:Endonuclease/exonuclease/phosphatase family protein n=1 Tax=Plantactinospora siamensis TaxID=555372 RepID=A0ABV6P245_9ACTN
MTAWTDATDGKPVVRERGRRRGTVLTSVAVLLAAGIAGHRLIPNVRGMGSLIDTAVPYAVLVLPPLLLAALLRRSRAALAAVGLPAAVWTVLVGLPWLPVGGGGPVQFRVASQNLMAGNPEPLSTVTALLRGGPDLVALEEIGDDDRAAVADALRAGYPYRAGVSTVGLWSRFPIREEVGVDTGLGWTRALRAVVSVPGGDVAVYVVHLGSARAGATGLRDRGVRMLADRVRRDPAPQLIVLGDLNTAPTDRIIGPLTSQLADAQAQAGTGPGFTWPARLPLTRPDQVLYRGLTAAAAGTVRTPASDHRAVTAGFRR